MYKLQACTISSSLVPEDTTLSARYPQILRNSIKSFLLYIVLLIIILYVAISSLLSKSSELILLLFCLLIKMRLTGYGSDGTLVIFSFTSHLLLMNSFALSLASSNACIHSSTEDIS
jgi:hypothetical protein